MKSILKKQHRNLFGISFLVNLLFLTFSLLNAYSDDLFIPLIDKADRARVEFNEMYKCFLEQNPEIFKDSSEMFGENFKLKPNISGRILDTGPVLLSLIEWLDKNKKDDAARLLLLRKLNRFLYLEFRHFVGHLNVNKKYEGRLVGLLHNFYKFKVPARAGSGEEKLKYEFPFQATISKAMLFILIVNASSLNYDEKVENVAYFLDKIRRELLEIKKCYADDCNIRTSDVSDFVELLQTYAAKEPLLGPNYLKRIIITVAIIGVIALVVWLAMNKTVRDTVFGKLKDGGNYIYDAVIDPWATKIAEKMYDNKKINEALRLLREHIKKLEQESLKMAFDAQVVGGIRQVVQVEPAVYPEPEVDENGHVHVPGLANADACVDDPEAAAAIAGAGDGGDLHTEPGALGRCVSYVSSFFYTNN